MHQLQIQVTTFFILNLQEHLHHTLWTAANYCTGKHDKWNPQTADVHLLAHSHSSFSLFTFFFSSPLHLFTAKSHGSSHWFRAITLVATGQQSGRGLGLTRPVIRVQQKPASPYSIAPAMGCHSSAAHPPGDFITQRQMNGAGIAWNFWEGMGRAGWSWATQAISLLSGNTPRVACQHATRRSSKRQRTTKEVAHFSSSGESNCGKRSETVTGQNATKLFPYVWELSSNQKSQLE